MNILRSRVAAVAAGTLIVVGLGAGGAHAADALSGDQLQNNTVDSTEVQDGTLRVRDLGTGSVSTLEIQQGAVRSVDIADRQVRGADIGEGVVQSAHLDLALRRQIAQDAAQDVKLVAHTLRGPGELSTDHGTVQVLLDVQSASAPTQVTVTNRLTSVVVAQCVATPAGSFEGTCSSTRIDGGGTYDVSVDGDQAADVQVSAVKIG